MSQVQLFATCLVDAFAPEVGRATVRVLERAGCRVEFPEDQSCCGQPAFNAGFTEQARTMAAHTVRVLDRTEGPIVLPSGSCADMLVHHAPRLLDGEPEHAVAVRVAERVRELTQFLVDDLGLSEIGGSGGGRRLVYHPSCHGFRNLGIRRQAETLLEAAEGVERVSLKEPEQCCGFGGLFSIEMPAVSAAIMNTKLDDIEESGAEMVVGGDLSCLMHLGGGLDRRGSRIEVAHIAQILAEGEPG